MIGLIVLVLGGAWLLISAKFASLLASRFKRPLAAALVAVPSFAAFSALPFIDEIVGRRQFANLCRTEAIVRLSPNAATVVAAKSVGDFSEVTGLIFPVRRQSIRYADLSNGEVFYSATAFHTPGGVLMRAGLGLGNSTSCWPERWTGRELGIDTNAMLQRGAQVQMLELFGAQLRELKSSAAASPRWVSTVPEPRPLVGATREAVLRALGAPDTCPAGAQEACMSARVWSYWFFRIPEGSRGITPVLHIHFDADGSVESAKWSFSK